MKHYEIEVSKLADNLNGAGEAEGQRQLLLPLLRRPISGDISCCGGGGGIC